MRLALQQAAQAAAAGEVPVGAVLVRDGQVIASGRNSPIGACDPLAHAEVLALRAGAAASGNYRLEDCTLYVTLEPCAMCSGAILHARLKRLVFATPDPKTGCAGSVLNLFAEARLNHQTRVDGGVLGGEAGGLLQDFFRHKREQQKALAEPLREDALRTPERCFAHLPGYAWIPRYVSDLAALAGLRLHFVDEGPGDSARVVLALHPVPGWSYNWRSRVAGWLGQGARVVMPDLIGFGRSDKPKREDFHAPEFHIRCVLELMERLDLNGIELVSATGSQWLADALVARAPDRIRQSRVELPDANATAAEQAACDAPFPDTGHRAAERAFVAPGLA